MTRKLGFVDFLTFKSLIDQYVSLSPEEARTQDTWLHHFGESLTHREFGQLIRYAVAKGVRACMSINPIMLTPPIADELLGSGISKLIISLDGHDDESFWKIRGMNGSYEKSKANLLEFLRKKVELGVQTRIVLSMIDFELNSKSIDYQRACWESLPGIDEFLPKPLSLWGGDATDINEILAERVDNQALRLRYPTPACNVPWESMCMTWEGEMVPCCFDYDKKYSLGNIGDGTLAEIWNGERMRALRREFITNNVTNTLCRNCPILYPPKG
jgi:radical SAM protein with 4Fe4S-binding SPASM domain